MTRLDASQLFMGQTCHHYAVKNRNTTQLFIWQAANFSNQTRTYIYTFIPPLIHTHLKYNFEFYILNTTLSQVQSYQTEIYFFQRQMSDWGELFIQTVNITTPVHALFNISDVQLLSHTYKTFTSTIFYWYFAKPIFYTLLWFFHIYTKEKVYCTAL